MAPEFGANGEERPIPPEGFGGGEWKPGQMSENGEFQAGQMPKANRGKNGRFESMNPDFTVPENSEMPPDFVMPPEKDKGKMTGGFMDGNRRNMKDCLIINGGYLEIHGDDDCLDANGNLIINGGTIKSINPNGSFYGNFGIVDPDGQLKIGENANLIFAAGSGSAESLKLTQNTITVYCENNHGSDDKITVTDADGNIVYDYAPKGSYRAVLIASDHIKSDEKYVITVGSETFETEITGKSTVVGTQTNGGMGFGRGQKMW